ncbi:NlpC/P60 family protein [Bacillus sp. 1P06AnD]|uniref:C40 family peptidase n=1 Tax=Bacillus sp. 1P06AnD TaxID=3132208 RepID=UPI0039A07C0D
MKKVMSLLIVSAFLLGLIPAKGLAATVSEKDIAAIANQYLGVPYKFGGNTPQGFDCSGYLVYVFNQVGISLPRTAADQYAKAGVPVSEEDLQVGDLVFYQETYKKGVSHSGMYIGNQSFISATDNGVTVSKMNNSYWKPKYTGAKRVLGNSPSVSFVDLSKDHYAFTAVADLTSKGIISGYQDGSFRPNDPVTRGQAAAIINRQLKHTPKSTISYPDVSGSNGFAKDIAAINELGIINGFTDGTYRPNETMTRAQMAVIVQRAFNIKKSVASSSAAENIYNDLNSSYWAFDAIITMNVIDLTQGFKTNVYRPLDSASRVDFSAAVYNGINAK